MSEKANLDDRPARGRPKRSQVDSFQARAWFNSIASILGTDSPHALEQIIEPDKVVHRDGKVITSRAWGKYRAGTRLPKDRDRKNGKFGTVAAAERIVPISGDVYRHLIWRVMRAPSMDFDLVTKELRAMKPSIAGCYIDLRHDRFTLESLLAQTLWRPVPIREGDYHAALDHLAVNLMFLRLDIVRHTEFERKEIGLNIDNALKSIAISPWIGPFHEELYNWLRENVLGDRSGVSG